MNNERFHPVQKVPPIAHALHKWDEYCKRLDYEYNGTNIISMQVPESEEVGFRYGSDGTMQSIAYIQQIYVTVEKPMWVEIKFTLSSDAICMRPKRAQSEESILGQTGNVLIEGVNGLYDVTQDLLIDFNGCTWRWRDRYFRLEEGKRVAYIEVFLGEKPLFINLRMMYYRNHLGYKYYEPWKKQPNKKPVAGWCSWEAFRRDIDLDKVNAICDFMKEKLQDYGLEYIQVDDGYQKMPLPYNPKGNMQEGWFTCDEAKFPNGHSEIVENIEKRGFRSAIWTNANITNEAFPIYHADSVVFYEGKPLKGEWIDFLYNCTKKTLEEHVKPTFKAFKEAGYQYVKIDAIRHLLFDGLHEAVRLGILTNEEAEEKFRSYMEVTREGLGEDIYYLASWGEMHEVIGVADACRIAMDANPTWAGVRMQLFEMARWFHSQRILFLNDPDHVCVRTKLEWAKSVLSLISLAGGLYMLSDTLDAYTEEKLEVIRKTLPTLQTQTAETGALSLDFPAYTWTKLHGFAVQSHETPVEAEEISLKDAYNMAGNYPTMENDHPFSTLWSFHIENEGNQWCVVGRFATIPLRECIVELKNVNLNKEDSYYAFDFWSQKNMGIVKDSISCKMLNIGECQIIGLRKVKDIPQFIASSRHVSMDAISVKKELWTENELCIYLEGVVGTTEAYYFAIPERFILSEVSIEDAQCEHEMIDDLLKVKVEFIGKEAVIRLVF